MSNTAQSEGNMIVRYLKVWRAFAVHSLNTQMEYKGNFILDLIIEIAWTLVTLFWIEVMFFHTQSIAGWSKGEVLLIYAIYRIGSGVSSILLRKNIFRFPRLVNSGDFDLLLTKPISILFHTFARIVSIDRFSQLVTSLLILGYALSLLNWPLSPVFASLLLLVTMLSAVIRFSFEIITVIPVFWLQKLENIGDVQLILFNPARYPRQAFPLWFNRIFTFIFPVMMVGAVPAEIVLQKSSPLLLAIMVLSALILIIVMKKFFYFALTNYASASS